MDAMKVLEIEKLEKQLRMAAGDMRYPATPDIVGKTDWRQLTRRRQAQSRRLAWGMVVAVVLVVSLLSVPGVRAKLLEYIQLGAVRIFLVGPTATATARPNVTVESPSITLLHSVLDLAGETTLEEARARADFPIPLPTYPEDLGLPDKVFFQEVGGQIVVLVWLEPGTTDQVRLSLHMLGPGAFASKGPPQVLSSTEVNGQPALWTEGDYVLVYKNGTHEFRRFINGLVLLWEMEGVTYRLESCLTMAEAVKIAESITAND